MPGNPGNSGYVCFCLVSSLRYSNVYIDFDEESLARNGTVILPRPACVPAQLL